MWRRRKKPDQPSPQPHPGIDPAPMSIPVESESSDLEAPDVAARRRHPGDYPPPGGYPPPDLPSPRD
jgi:hypothetical protein